MESFLLEQLDMHAPGSFVDRDATLSARKGTVELTRGACYGPGVQVTLNGETRELPEGLTVSALLGELGLRERRIAVEINREVLPRNEYGRSIREGDEIEIVHFVGGG